MIVAALQICTKYSHVFPGLAQAFEWLRTTNLARLEAGRHPIDGERIYASVAEYRTKPVEEGFWEAHRRYVDVQLVVSGTERFGFGHLHEMRFVSHDESRDLSVLEGDGDFFLLRPGLVAVLFPDDAHMPGLWAGSAPETVRKIVVKIALP
ncbi:MAG TPA: YhcH/YjgK/YiaL family protein [Candidatus Ozemobacteraceae bacterium]|nr:YhcH/YjgK/YiaL family protein [Candidatus Ozemobacteraceae bacterium]HQG27123.1 YhcH/YjgK/YiaL family protein [Candidatus Ozemobacteraceae bacterium]